LPSQNSQLSLGLAHALLQIAQFKIQLILETTQVKDRRGIFGQQQQACSNPPDFMLSRIEVGFPSGKCLLSLFHLAERTAAKQNKTHNHARYVPCLH
jgi:hypothetical protein